jgi:hypothetical protein
MLSVKWKPFLTRVVCWAIAEVLLTLLGLDNLADYSEYLSDRHSTIVLCN